MKVMRFYLMYMCVWINGMYYNTKKNMRGVFNDSL